VQLYHDSSICFQRVGAELSTGTTSPYFNFMVNRATWNRTFFQLLVRDQASIQRVPGGSFPGGKATGAWIWPYLHLVPRSRMRGAILPLPQYVFMAWCSVKRKHRDNFTLYPNRDTIYRPQPSSYRPFFTAPVQIYLRQMLYVWTLYVQNYTQEMLTTETLRSDEILRNRSNKYNRHSWWK
jgi:hypothetical protein